MKKKLIMAGLLFMLTGISGFSAGERVPSGGRSLAMAGTSVAASDVWSANNNMAGIAWLKGVRVGAAFENRFFVKELMYQQIGLALPFKAGAFGMSVNRFGNSHYSELKAGLSFARKFGKHFSAGVQFDYLRIQIGDGYGSKNLLSCELGLLYVDEKHFSVGVHLVNPVPAGLTVFPPEPLPAALCAGFTYLFSNSFLISMELEKDLEHPMVFRTGAEYHFAQPAYARIGFSTGPGSFAFGFGLEFGKITIDVASGYHQVLGFSPSGSLTCSFD